MRPEYIKELQDLKLQMEKAEKFAALVPCYEALIIERKLTGEEHHQNFGSMYKKKYISWDIYRTFYTDNITNYEGSVNKYLFKIYINTLSLYDSHEKFGLDEMIPKDSYFFFDPYNTTYYVQDDVIEYFMDHLIKWLDQTKEKVKPFKLKERQDKLNAELEKINKEMEISNHIHTKTGE